MYIYYYETKIKAEKSIAKKLEVSFILHNAEFDLNLEIELHEFKAKVRCFRFCFLVFRTKIEQFDYLKTEVFLELLFNNNGL